MAIDKQAVAYASVSAEVNPNQALSVLTMMIEEDCTVPFITRYRKEKTGGLDEDNIRAIHEAYEGYIEREKRREFILETLKKQEQLTPELQKKVMSAETLNQLEDLYAPYKSKKKSKGMIAIEAGLGPIAELMMITELELAPFIAKHGPACINPEMKITSPKEIIEGACNIIVEKFAHDTDVKETLRKDYWKDATLNSGKKRGADEVKNVEKYKDYFEFSQRAVELKDPKASHRFLAMRRGMTEKVLKVDVVYPEDEAVATIENKYLKGNLGMRDLLFQCAKKSYQNYIHPSLDLELKSELKKLSDESAIDVFGVNLKNLLLQPYLGAKTVLGIDPGIRTGCKIALVDNTGKFLVDTVIYPHEPRNATRESKQILEAMIEQFKIDYIAIGNGTFGRETLDFIEEMIDPVKKGTTKATLVNEDGASIYSASPIAKEEFPDKDATVRGAISIARRFQDPLAELVKIDPKSIGVGQYQHDVNQTRLKKSLEGVVESCVNFVGVDLNTASAPLLSYISGIGPTLAKNVVKHREKSGKFNNRSELLKVTRFSQKVFEQAAGFLRIYGGNENLDRTSIHPERYDTLKVWAKENGANVDDLSGNKDLASKLQRDNKLKDEIGDFTLADIVKSLTAPSQDPRTEFKSTEFRKDIKGIKDLKIGQWYPGLVTNITQFGAFVDIGIKENGLLHISQMADKFVENALEVLKVGEEVKVKVLDVDMGRKRISLSCKKGDDENAPVQDFASRGGPGKGKAKKDRPQASFKNNAFAGLAGLKLK
ncbi:MAG: RNA-binding transcriptional accessory protein [Bacteriovoracaceae bacterium]|nr:RNA-binding transcriptional accessory protein [Bacteriovoracaceae bacterium]